MACPGSLVLPRTDERSERAVAAAEWGTGVHRWMETGEFPDGRLGTTLKKKVKESGADRVALWPKGLHEVPVAYNVVSTRALALVLPATDEQKDAWKAGFGDEWVSGTADYVGELLEAPWVDDLKTGRLVEYESYRYQQGLYTLAWTLFNYQELVDTRSTVTHWPKYPIPKPPTRFGTVWTVEGLQELQGKLKQLREDTMKLRELENSGRRESVVVRLSDGPQCKYCPSRLACAKGMKYDV